MSDETPTVHQALQEAGCKLDHHESDLYVEDTAKAREIIERYGLKATPFRNQVDQAMWLDLPFMYQPFWDQKARIHRSS
mgnify:CR=1 FL=1|tara:strand:- start:11455 stop:11691 length:237 start_codon:yes stop_codon:yes gene_type:complete